MLTFFSRLSTSIWSSASPRGLGHIRCRRPAIVLSFNCTTVRPISSAVSSDEVPSGSKVGPPEAKHRRKTVLSFTTAEDDYILRERERGVSCDIIGQHLGRRGSGVYARYRTLLFHRDGPSVKPCKSLLFSAAEDEVIIRMNKEGVTASETAKKLSGKVQRTQPQITTRISQLRRGGVVVRKKKVPALTDAEFLHYKALRDAKHTWQQIAMAEKKNTQVLRKRYQRKLAEVTNPKGASSVATILRLPWSDVETKKMLQLKSREGLSYAEIAACLGRSHGSIKGRFRALAKLREPREQHTYSAEEDAKLKDLIRQYGNRWQIIQLHMGHRSYESVRARYRNHLCIKMEPLEVIKRQRGASETDPPSPKSET